MGAFLPGLIWGVLAPVVVIIGAMWLLRRWRTQTFGGRKDYTGAMGSAAMEAMMSEARRQRELLHSDPDDPSEGHAPNRDASKD